MESALLRYYNGVVLRLAEEPDEYRPLLEKDEGIGAGVVWKPWIVGFAVLDVQESVQVSQMLYDAAKGRSELEPMGLDLLDDMAPMLIGDLVCDLNAARNSRG